MHNWNGGHEERRDWIMWEMYTYGKRRTHVGAYPMAEFLRGKRLTWFGYLHRLYKDEVASTIFQMAVDGKRNRDRPKLRRRDLVKVVLDLAYRPVFKKVLAKFLTWNRSTGTTDMKNHRVTFLPHRHEWRQSHTKYGRCYTCDENQCCRCLEYTQVWYL